MLRFEKTDFRDSTEFIALAKMGRLPADFGKRPGDFEMDKQFHSVELAAIGITSGEEYRKAMRRFKVSFQ